MTMQHGGKRVGVGQPLRLLLLRACGGRIAALLDLEKRVGRRLAGRGEREAAGSVNLRVLPAKR